MHRVTWLFRTGAFALTLVSSVSVARSAQAQGASAPDTAASAQRDSASHQQVSTARRVLAFLAPEVGLVIGRSVAGTTGAIVGASVGMVAGGAIALADPAAHQARTDDQQLCLVPGDAGTPGYVIPGTPPTPAIGDIPAVPGTPDVIVPGTPPTPARWERCR